MSVFAPDTDLRLVKCPLTYGDGHQLDFATAAAQATYFSGLTGKAYTDFSYQRKDHIIRIPDLAENIYPYNYVMYRNKSSAKWFYAFITKIEFINQNCTHVHIRTDVFQTWMFDFSFKQCTVIREHTATDNPYEHTLPENLESGELVEIYRKKASVLEVKGDTAVDFDANFKVVVCMSEELKNAGITTAPPPMCGGVPAAARYYAVDRLNVRSLLDHITTNEQADAVISVYACPLISGRNVFTAITTTLGYTVYSVQDTSETEITYEVPKRAFVPAVTVSTPAYVTFNNKKCLCYPYHFLRLWTSEGQSVDLKIENFTNIAHSTAAESIKIRTTVNPAQEVSMICAPENYLYTNKGENNAYGANYSYAVTYNGFPELAWATDVFKNYMALNKSSVRATMFNTAVNTVFGVGRGTLSGIQGAGSLLDAVNGLDVDAGIGSLQQIMGAGQQVYNAVGSAMSAYARFQDMQRIPDRLRGLTAVPAMAMTGAPGVYISEMCVKAEYLKMVDDYFTRFGYLVNILKVPQFNSRPNHNYLQTADCNIEGDMPQDDSDELCAMFNRGLTIWHNPAKFGDYTVSNSPSP